MRLEAWASGADGAQCARRQRGGEGNILDRNDAHSAQCPGQLDRTGKNFIVHSATSVLSSLND